MRITLCGLFAVCCFGGLLLTVSSQAQTEYVIAYTDNDSQMGSRLCFIEIDSTKPVCPDQPQISSVSRPLWSPDGLSIAFVANSDGYRQQIHVREMSTQHAKRLTQLQFPVQEFVWLDGHHILFAVLDSRSSDVPILLLYQLDVESAVLTHLDAVPALVAKIEPSTQQVALMIVDLKQNQGDLTLYGVAQKRQVRVLTSDKALKVPAAWSPDGDSVAYFQAQGDPLHNRTEVWVVNQDGTGQKLIGRIVEMAYSYLATSISWSPDNQRIAAISQNDLYTWEVSTTIPLKLTQDSIVKRHPRWSPDGEYIAYLRQEKNGWGLVVFHVSSGENRYLTTASGEPPAWKPLTH